ncbi:MAG: dTDP-4-dehydrorhamnose 3,5-epimerase [Hyphomicrobium sp.]
MHIEPLAIHCVKILTPQLYADERGYFCETWSAAAFARAGLPDHFVQDNHASSIKAGTVRGLHYQKNPHAQGKLVRVVRGSIIDVAVDLRRSSPSYGQHVSVLLSADNKRQMWVPPGFAHGYATLDPNTDVIYKVTHGYAPGTEGGILWNDPALAIDWQLNGLIPVLSEKDKRLLPLAQTDHGF